eukprot:326853-Lingulodinium_polyedra.AAC.1
MIWSCATAAVMSTLGTPIRERLFRGNMTQSMSPSRGVRRCRVTRCVRRSFFMSPVRAMTKLLLSM